MVIDKIPKMSAKGVKLKSESYFSKSPGVLESWRKNARGADAAPPGPVGLNLFFLIFSFATLRYQSTDADNVSNPVDQEY